MPCQHHTKLYQLMQQTGLKLSSSDIIRITCPECGEIEVCPSVYFQEYESMEKTLQSKHSASTQQRSEDEEILGNSTQRYRRSTR